MDPILPKVGASGKPGAVHDACAICFGPIIRLILPCRFRIESDRRGYFNNPFFNGIRASQTLKSGFLEVSKLRISK
jgi:hypothetical protein